MLQMKIFPVTQSCSEYLSTNRMKISAKTQKNLPNVSHLFHISEFSHYKMGHNFLTVHSSGINLVANER